MIPRAADRWASKDDDDQDEADMDFDAEFGFEPLQPNPPPILTLSSSGGANGAPRGPKFKKSPYAHERPTDANNDDPTTDDATTTNAVTAAAAAAATRNISPRRVQSAPTNLLKIYDESLLFEHDEEQDEWFVVPSVKAKAERRLGRKGGLVGATAAASQGDDDNHREDDDDDTDHDDDADTFGQKTGSRHGLRAGTGRTPALTDENMESWDDDFDVDDGKVVDNESNDGGKAAGRPLRIPDAVQNLQHQIKGDAVNLKKFALHIEDLKFLNSDATDMAAGVPASLRPRLAALRARYAADLLKVQVLIALGDYAEDDDADNDDGGAAGASPAAPTEQHLRVLVDMLVGGANGRNGNGKGGLPPAAARELEQMVRDGTLVFGVELMPALIKHMAPLKLSLSKYVEDVRAVLMTAET
ncbi:hypothetical protein HDU86_004783 [Geranomyces michiganensis]|nr:hypothetical protein HDU86_004783 [Geranomyces michiganensis]